MNNLIAELREWLKRCDYIGRKTILDIVIKHLGTDGVLYNIEYLIDEGVIAEITFGQGVHIYVDGKERIHFRKHDASMGA